MARVFVHDHPSLLGPGGSPVSFEAVDIRNVNFNNMNAYRVGWWGVTAIPVGSPWNGIEYYFHDGYDFTIGGTSYSTVLLLKNGIQGLVDMEYIGLYGAPGTARHPKVTVDKFAISTSSYWSAANSASTTDDKALMEQILSANDVIKLSTFGDFYRGYAGNDQMFGEGGNDKLFGDGGHDRIDGGVGNDKISGGIGNDILFGRSGNDVMSGNKGADRFIGGSGKDKMFAGVDNQQDTFVFTAISDTKVDALRDLIYQFESGEDKIDLSQIDANTSVAGDQSFGVNGSTAAANSIWISISGSNGVINGDVDGDAIADFQIEFIGVWVLNSTDFIL